nr:uncharacterized protein LOC129528302 [Gorilla gorilla gorilla]XP_055224249.1 uncharacterized protein LOC129528302 [Gorilla gorilla gorilla]
MAIAQCRSRFASSLPFLLAELQAPAQRSKKRANRSYSHVHQITDSTELSLSGEIGYRESSHLEREDSPLQAASILSSASLLPASLHLEPKASRGHHLLLPAAPSSICTASHAASPDSSVGTAPSTASGKESPL